MVDVVIHDAEVDGRRVDVAVGSGKIQSIGPARSIAWGPASIDAGGGALLPGLHDHHLHLLATAAARTSIHVGPPNVRSMADLADVVRSAEVDDRGWLRATGYHESVAGQLDRWTLDVIEGERPIRVQHRSGQMWILNSRAIDELGIASMGREGVERDGNGRPTGRLFRMDDVVRKASPELTGRDLAVVVEQLRMAGVTSATDASPFDSIEPLRTIAAGVRSGAVGLHVTVTGGVELLGERLPDGLVAGPVKLVLDDDRLPSLGTFADDIRAAHRHNRPVAVHAVSTLSLAFALAGFARTGAVRGDRIEHASVAPPDLVIQLAQRGLGVVTQPSLVAEQGDRYLDETEPEERDHLYPVASLMRAGVPVAFSSDAPYASFDPWTAVAAATSRLAPGGRVVGPDERTSALTALRAYLGGANEPFVPRHVQVGGAADLCLLKVPLAEALAEPSSESVRATLLRGEITEHRPR